MSTSRRHFINVASISVLGATSACNNKKPKLGELPPGTPPAFGTSPPVGPEVAPSTFSEAEKLMQVNLRP